MHGTLFQTFEQLLLPYRQNPPRTQHLWASLLKAYTHKNRHYHNLQHLQQMLQQLGQVQALIQNWDAILFALFYHDVVYNPLQKNNEHKSAQIASQCLKPLGVPPHTLQLCEQHILATATHLQQATPDTNYFTDADLSILGQNPYQYQQYCLQIRKEYHVFPDLLYNPGRIKVLQHFLAMPTIFKTQPFITLYEHAARRNIEQELLQLQSQ